MKMGDIILNPWAGDANPRKISIFIGWSGKYRHCLCSSGHISRYEKDVPLEVIGNIPIQKIIKDKFEERT